jgi:hypothetical protein
MKGKQQGEEEGDPQLGHWETLVFPYAPPLWGEEETEVVLAESNPRPRRSLSLARTNESHLLREAVPQPQAGLVLLSHSGMYL